MMKLWLLEKRDDLSEQDNMWEPTYPKMFSCVVRAQTEEAARAIADKNGSNENHPSYLYEAAGGIPAKVWLDNKYTTCKELPGITEGPEELISKEMRFLDMEEQKDYLD